MSTVRILEIDGGGIRGLFAAYFMQMFCEQAGITNVWKYFDIIIGTSIGGISALAYANGLSPSDLINLLITNGPLIFPYSTFPFNTGPASAAAIASYVTTYGYVYNNAPLINAATSVLGTIKMFQLKTNVLIPSVVIQNDMFDNFKNYSPRLFSNSITSYTTGQNYLATDVAMATSAAPAYFPAWSISNVVNPQGVTNLFIDGGLYQNNATGLGYAMSKILFPGNNKICILSVGTGLDKSQPDIPTPDSLTWRNMKNLELKSTLTSLPVLLSNSLSITLGSAQEAVNNQFRIQSLYNNIGSNSLYYYRFQTRLDPAQGNQLDNATAGYMAYLQTAAEQQYALDQMKISAFIQNAQF